MRDSERGRSREREREIGRERERESQTDCTVSTEPDAGLEPMNCEIMTKNQTLNQLRNPATPSLFL